MSTTVGMCVAIVMLLLGGAGMAQDRESLETRATATNGAVVLEWSRKHLFDSELQSTPPSLLAEYRIAGGRVVLDCLMEGGSSAARAAGRCAGALRSGTPAMRSLRFTLPTGLSATPIGPVCLVLQRQNGRPLPLRRADGGSTETARFRYIEWEEAATQRTANARLERRASQLRDSIRLTEAAAAAQQGANARSGGNDSTTCRGIDTPAVSSTGGSDRPVIDVDKLPVLAARVCVMQVWRGDSILSAGRRPLAERLGLGVVLPPPVLQEVIGWMPAPVRASFMRLRGSQLDGYRADWAGYASSIARYRAQLREAGLEPEFGQLRELLWIQETARGAGKTIAAARAAGQPPNPQALAGFVGSNLEAYSRCKEDGVAQMRRTAASNARIDASDPEILRAAQQALVSGCLSGVEKLGRLQETLRRLGQELQQVEQGIASSDVARVEHRTRELNREACRP